MSRTRRIQRWFVAGIITALVLFGSRSPASAHADLLDTDPPADGVLHETPPEIVLTFTEPVDPTDQAIRLVTADGAPVEIGPVTQARGADSITAVIPDALGDGSYVIAWSVVSADSHPIRGAFVFSIGAPSQGADDLAGGMLDPGIETSSSWLAVGRFASYTGIAALTGTLAAAVTLAPSTMHRRRLAGVLFTAGYLAMAGTIVMISAQAHLIGASFTDWPAVANTRSGAWWLARLVIVATITGLVLWRRLLAHQAVQLAATLASLGLFAVVAAGGHSMSGRWVGIAIAATVIHLAAMALWLGGVLLIVLIVDRHAVMDTAARFSPLALGAVAALSTTGLVNSWRQLDGLGALTDSRYGRWLIVKVAVVSVAVAVAAVSRRLIRRSASLAVSAKPALTSSAAATTHSNTEPPLRRSLIIEGVAMVVILATTAGLTGATPPRQAGVSTTADANVTVAHDDHIAQIDLLPAVTGGTTLHVTITSPAGSLDPADEITVTAELPDQQIGPLDIPTIPAGPNHVTTNKANLPIPGDWAITITARYGEFDQRSFTANVSITPP